MHRAEATVLITTNISFVTYLSANQILFVVHLEYAGFTIVRPRSGVARLSWCHLT